MSEESTEIPMKEYLPPDADHLDEPEVSGADIVEMETEIVDSNDLAEFLAEMEEIEASLETEPEPEPESPVQYDPLVAAAQLSEKIQQEEQDNIEAAMEKVAETLDPKISTKISDDDGPADKQILIRSTQRDHERWKLAAEREGKSLSAFVREIVNIQVTEILDCSHPAEYRQSYPWSETCLKCGTRLRDEGDTHIENRR